MKFSEHGVFSIEIENKILLVDASGPFNDELIKKYQLALHKAVESFNGEPWQQIIVIRDEGLFTPEAEKILIETMSWRKSKGMYFSAVVIGEAVAQAITRQQITRCYEQVGIPHEYFDTVESAREHLNKRVL